MSHKTLPNLALITPYPALAAVVTEQCTGIFNCHVFHGSLEKAAGIARNLDPDFYDIIISRGGTADYIDRVTKIPVVRILTSALDLLKSLTPLKKHPHKIAFFNYQKNLSFCRTPTWSINSKNAVHAISRRLQEDYRCQTRRNTMRCKEF